jgi:hypothetical protein
VIESERDVENADESVGNMETMPEVVNESADLYDSSHSLTSGNDSDEESDEATVVRFDCYTIKTFYTSYYNYRAILSLVILSTCTYLVRLITLETT